MHAFGTTDVARLLSRSPTTVRRWARAGRIQGFRSGIESDGWWIFELPAVADFIVTARGLDPRSAPLPIAA